MSRVRGLCHQLRSSDSHDPGTEPDDKAASNEHAQVLCSTLKSRPNCDEGGTDCDRFLPPKDLAQLGGEKCGDQNANVDSVDQSTQLGTLLFTILED